MVVWWYSFSSENICTYIYTHNKEIHVHVHTYLCMMVYIEIWLFDGTLEVILHLCKEVHVHMFTDFDGTLLVTLHLRKEVPVHICVQIVISNFTCICEITYVYICINLYMLCSQHSASACLCHAEARNACCLLLQDLLHI